MEQRLSHLLSLQWLASVFYFTFLLCILYLFHYTVLNVRPRLKIPVVTRLCTLCHKIFSSSISQDIATLRTKAYLSSRFSVVIAVFLFSFFFSKKSLLVVVERNDYYLQSNCKQMQKISYRLNVGHINTVVGHLAAGA